MGVLLRFFGCCAVRAGLAPPEVRPGCAFGSASQTSFASPKRRHFVGVHYPAASASLRFAPGRPEKPPSTAM
ncbi:hypothetical protein RCIA108 [Methanocella arvoryzae MRE50]|uniref:Uncharacterized protein n=1 Tax=Methanocella arvoryzae (strain DSM 22066 / NBRC 105507 / MRE50) TaxID=351160 RepID=Q0W4J3_METAR|nr:hypothetical protein RCIA108 [Methanocella arvoryzae MRE50]